MLLNILGRTGMAPTTKNLVQNVHGAKGEGQPALQKWR